MNNDKKIVMRKLIVAGTILVAAIVAVAVITKIDNNIPSEIE